MVGEPFGGSESSLLNPNTYIRIGIITDILDDKQLGSNNANNTNAYLSVKIDWLDRGGRDGSFNSQTGIIPLSYSHLGRGWGQGLHCPSKGDIVACGFRMGGYPVILSYLPRNYYSQVMGKDEKGYYLRNLSEGEYCTKSKNGAEWYLNMLS